MAGITGRKRIAHLLRRTGFGGSADEIDSYTSLGFEGAVARLVDYEGVPNDRMDARVAEMESGLDLSKLPSIQMIWLYRMLNTARPLEEKMTLFWHDHFATANYKVGRPQAMYDQNTLFRSHAVGSYRDLLHGISRDPAMLRWLDGNANRKASPNENYARELMELFTMGIGHYTEADVKAAARAFTGWFIDRNRNFIFNANQHDGGTKTFLGRSGPWNGDDVVDIILDQPSAAEFLTRKLFGFLVHDHPSSEAVLRLAATFQGSGYSIRELVRAILLSPEFSSEDSYHALVKSPVEYLVGTLKLLGIAEISPTALGALQRMGMVLFNPPNVAGWAWGDDWIGSASLLERLNVANALVTQRGDNARFGLDPTALLERLGAHSPTEIVAGLLDLLVEGDVPAGVRESLLAYAMNGYPGSPADFASNAQRVDRAVRGVARLVMATPASQMA